MYSKINLTKVLSAMQNYYYRQTKLNMLIPRKVVCLRTKNLFRSLRWFNHNNNELDCGLFLLRPNKAKKAFSLSVVVICTLTKLSKT